MHLKRASERRHVEGCTTNFLIQLEAREHKPRYETTYRPGPLPVERSRSRQPQLRY